MQTRHFAVRVALLHRIGVVPVGEASVVVAASSVHRREAMAAVQFGIDTLKARVPIWKTVAHNARTFAPLAIVLCSCISLFAQEVYAEGPSQWKVNCECVAHRAQAAAQLRERQQQQQLCIHQGDGESTDVHHGHSHVA